MRNATTSSRSKTMPRVTSGLWSAIAQRLDDEDRAAFEERARGGLAKLSLHPALARVEDFPASADDTEVGACGAGATVISLAAYRRR